MTTLHLNPCEQYSPYVVDYCLGTLDPALQIAFEQALTECPELAEMVATYQGLAESLLQSVPLHKAPPQVLENILLATNSRRLLVLPRISLRTLVAVFALLLFGLSNLYWFTHARNLEEKLNHNPKQMVMVVTATPANAYENAIQPPLQQIPVGLAMNTTLTQSNNYSAMNPVNQYITQQDNQQAALTWAEGSVPNTWIGVFTAQNFQAPPENNAYQLWLYDDEAQATSAGVFNVDALGNGILVFQLAESIETFKQMVITAEPIAGSPQPTGRSVLSADLLD